MPVCYRRNGESFAAQVVNVTERGESPICDLAVFSVDARMWILVQRIPFHRSGPLPENGSEDKPTELFHEVGGPYDRFGPIDPPRGTEPTPPALVGASPRMTSGVGQDEPNAP